MILSDLVDLAVSLRWADARTLEARVRDAQEVVDVLGASRDPSRIDGAAVQDLARKLGARYAPATVNRKLSALSVLLGVAVNRGVLEEAPPIPWRREPPGRTRVLTELEEVDLLAAMDSAGDRLAAHLVVVLVETGLRLSEAYEADRRGDRLVLRRTKNGTQRVVPLTARAAESWGEIEAHGRPSRSAFRKAWARARRRLGLERDREYVPHALRHTCASRLVARGVNLAVVQRWLGHRDLQSTMRYAHVGDSELVGARDRMEALP